MPQRAIVLGLLICAAGVACRARPDSAVDRPPTALPPADTPGGRLAFALVSPRVGDTLIEGHAYVVRWLAPDTFRINLGALMGGKDKGYLLTNAPATPDSMVWTVPEGFVTGFGIASSDVVRLRLENAGNPEQWTEAGPFTIRGALR